MPSNRPLPGLLILDGLLADDDLELLTTIATDLAFEPQDLGRGVISARYRAVTDDPRIPRRLSRAISPELPELPSFFDDGLDTPRLDPPLTEWHATGCNPRTRFYRYGPGAQFSEHADEPWCPNPQTRTFLTLLVYLDDRCEGGETVINGEVIAPAASRIIVFDHGLLHQGQPVAKGSKLVARSDVVGKPTVP